MFVGMGAMCLAAVMMSTTAFAAETPRSEDDSYVYYVDGVQVEKSEFPNQERSLKNMGVASEIPDTSNMDYYVMSAEGLKAVSVDEYNEIVGSTPSVDSRTTGSWSIRNSEISSGGLKYYYQSNGDDFEVDSNEYIELTINIGNHDRYFGVGYTGTSALLENIEIPDGRGARVAFIDRLVVPGTYSVMIENLGDETEFIDGRIEVLKR